MEIQLNIGLGNNPFAYEQASVMVQAILSASGGTDIKSRKDDGVYNGEHEENVVMKFDFSGEYLVLRSKIKAIANIMNQECIAVYIPETETGSLCFQHGWQWEGYPFNLKFFKQF
jgi:hypothetical protein